MKRKFTFLIAALFAITLITQPKMVMGQSKGYSEMFTINSSDVVSSSYGSYTYTDGSSRGFLITYGGGSNAVGSNKNNISSCKLTSYSKYAVSPVTISNTASAFACTTSISNVSKISFKVGGGEYSTTQVYLIYSADDKTYSQITLTGSTAQGCSITTSAKEFEFSPLSGYFALVFTSNITNAAWRNQNVEIKFYKTTYNITYDANEATGGTVPSATTHDAGSNATVASNTGTLVRTGYNFSGWNIAEDGSGTDYAEGATISSIAQDYTLYAKWTSASSPNIVVSGTGIASNALNLAYTASGAKTATASYNNMPSGYSNAEVALYNDLECTEAFGGDWFSASLNESDKTEIDYSANANIGVARTVYMRVSADYSETTYYSNVITVTQAALPCTVTYNKNNASASGEMEDNDSPYDYGSTVTVLDNEFTAPTGKVFYKWNTKADASGQWYKADDTFEITENTTLYAQWNDIPKYVYVTSLSQVIPGKHYILASSIDKDTKADVMDAQNGSTYRDKKTTTTYIAEGDVDGDGNDDIYIQEDGLYEFVISGDMSVEISGETYISYTIYDKTNKGYLCNSGSTNLSVNTTAINDASRWVLEFWKDTDDDIRLKIRNVDVTGNYLQYNPSSPRYKTYTGSQKHPFLYMKYDDNDCEIYSATTLSKNESYTNLTIVKGTYVNGSVTVPNNKTLNVSGTLTNNGTAANLIIEDGGQLITTNSVAATMKKNISAATITPSVTNWYAISTSAHDSDHAYESITNVTNLTSGSYDMLYYKESTGHWMNQKNDGVAAGYDTLQMGRGYIYRNAAAKTLSFTGVTQSGSVNYPLTYTEATGDLKSFHLIGNPYTHDIYKGTNAAIPNTYLEEDFYTLTSAGGWEVGTDNITPIKPNMAVLVQATSSADKKALVITKTTNQGPSAPAKSGNDMIKFMVNNSEYNDATYVFFKEGRGLNKIEHKNPDIPMLYINHNDENFAVVDMDDNTQSFNLNFKAKIMGKYTISYKAEGLFSYLHIIDRLSGEDVDMLVEDEYSFIASPNDSDNRFIVKLAYNPGNTVSNNDIFAYQSGSDIVVTGTGELQIFDVTGRMVQKFNVNGVENINVLSQGVYVFRLIGNEVQTQKIVVR